MSVTNVVPSGLTDGQTLKVVATSTPGTTFHTADAAALDEIWLWAVNKDTVNRTLTVEFGGASADQNITIVLEPNVPTPVLMGPKITNSKTVKLFAAAANVVGAWGNVYRHT